MSYSAGAKIHRTNSYNDLLELGNDDGACLLRVFRDPRKSIVDGLLRVARGDVETPRCLRCSLAKLVLVVDHFFGTKDDFRAHTYLLYYCGAPDDSYL